MSETLEALALRLRALTARRTGLAVCVWGEAGIGKTHSVHAVLRATPCRSLSVSARLTDAAWIQVLLQAEPRPAHLPTWAAQVLARLQSGAGVDAATSLKALGAVLAGLAPFVLHLEDLHEASPHGRDQAAALAQLVGRTRGVGLLATSRTPPLEGFEGVQLRPLLPLAAARMLEAEAGSALPEPALAWIFERAAGNPLFTLEYFRLLARQGHLWNNTQRWHWRSPLPEVMPLTVEAVIEQLLFAAAHVPAVPLALDAAALLGEPLTDEVWAEVAELSAAELAQAKAALERVRVWSGQRFSHPLYREVALRRLVASERQRLARRALVALHGDPQRAAALIESADLAPAEALSWCLRAAAAAGNMIQTARLTAQATQYAQGEQRAALSQAAARGLRDVDPASALQLAEIACAAVPEDADMLWFWAEVLAEQGRLAEAEQVMERLPEAQRTGTGGAGRLIRLRASARDTTGVLTLWHRTPELHTDPEPELACAVAFALAVQGEPRAASALALQTLEHPKLDATTRCELINVLGVACYAVNDFVAAAEHQRRAVLEAQKLGSARLEALFLSNRAMALGELGRHRERMLDLEASLRLHAASGQLLQVSRTQVAVADAYLDLAQYEQAEEVLLECRAALSRLPVADHLIECEYRLSVLYRHWAPPHGGLLSVKHAQAALAYARQIANPRKEAWSLAYASLAEAAVGHAQQAEALAAQALALGQRLESPGVLGMARFAQAHALEASGGREAALLAFEQLETDLNAQGITDAAQEVGLEADRVAGRADRAAERMAWFRQHEMLNLAGVAGRYFPGLQRLPVGADPLESGAGLGSAVLRLDVLGPMRCGPLGQVTPVKGRKRRELLAALLDACLRGRPELARTDLLDLLYPATDELQAAAALRELVHTTRTALGSGVIQTTPTGYALGNVASDAHAFLTGGSTQLWRGVYLQDAAPERQDETVAEALCLALRARIGAALPTDPQEAARSARLLLEAEPYDLAALRLTLQALRASGNHRSLGRVYAEAATRLREVGEQVPPRWADFLAQPT
ncbi:AAA family ATPase [Deinococcus oregonensis]|uniref:AAA family ATPase n=1 Tax=Deinococcus oregonensis TaxID=1805970 RepID=A0ABV6AV85_9DEIO